MRLWHVLFATLMVAFGMTIAQDPAGRVALIVFVTGVGAVVLGTSALLLLFRSVGAIGQARGLAAHVEALAVTLCVLMVATLLLTAWLFGGCWILQASID